MNYKECYGCDLEYAKEMFATGERQKLYSDFWKNLKHFKCVTTMCCVRATSKCFEGIEVL